ncbi:Mechanosensitive ion channel family protein [Stachybotrys elegans]|uniref:Mechanosensitive ion channel protein n=1 Tax=Stachybotrys elegans TaxID=80388 RepID=A0A8K0WQF3_9HYPO|nr:Mechanosensitive ion channel family protein [Stachybotrys elegans]
MPLHRKANRADINRLNDDIELLRAEKLISNQEHDVASKLHRAHAIEPDDTFNQPVHKDDLTVKRKDTNAALYKFWLFLKKFPRFIRYFVYLFPGAGLLLIPVLLGYYRWPDGSRTVGGVYIMWFGIWLEIVWCSLWVSRMVTSLMPPIFHLVAKMAGSVNANKWRDIGAQLELHTALFFWMLAVLVSFWPVVAGHRFRPPPDENDESEIDSDWIYIVQRVIIAIFVLAALNFVEKLLIQWIATSFHQRTYATRIENHKGDVRQIVQLYEYAKSHLEANDPFWQGSDNTQMSGTQTPMLRFHNNARHVFGKVSYVANKVGNDFIGRKVNNNHPRKVVSELLRTTSSAHTLARLIYRSLVRPGEENVTMADMQAAFASEEDAAAAFGVFDKDLNGDISVDEFEVVCSEIGLEKKAIAASLKDLDGVIHRLDHVFLFIIVVISIIVFISIISGSAAAGLASAGTSVLGLAWMLQATAQEFLQSIIFVFVKHPFDVGDRVTIYGSTGATLTGDDYYVTEVSLLYTEFKKMQGHIVQAPNSVLNTLFILNQRRSNGLADIVPLVMRFGTTQDQIEGLKARMLEFVTNNKRDYRSEIISEMTSVDDVRSCSMNIVFFHKSNWQNELLRLNRRNKFVTELMYQMTQVGIQPPMRADAGGSRENPFFWAGAPPPPSYSKEAEQDPDQDGPVASGAADMPPRPRRPSVLSASASTRSGGGMESNMNDFQDVFESRRDQVFAQRLASIREKDRGAKAEDEASEGRASTSALAPTGSHGSQAASQTQSRSRIFGRARSKSKAQPPSGHIV